MKQAYLFEELYNEERLSEPVTDLHYFSGLALDFIAELLLEIDRVTKESPLRHMQTPGGYQMSVAMTNCGEVGWISDKSGYRYSELDPLTGLAWPQMPPVFRQLASLAATKAGYPLFSPDACLINQYLPGAKMSLHQDKDEKDFSAPIVSVSLGVSAVFKIGGMKRSDKLFAIPLHHGDVVVWGKSLRLAYHSISPIKSENHALLEQRRINLTFRKASF